jgi:hypothetical protein
VAAVLDPNVTSSGLMSRPDEKVASYRVRACYHGASSGLAHGATTPD